MLRGSQCSTPASHALIFVERGYGHGCLLTQQHAAAVLRKVLVFVLNAHHVAPSKPPPPPRPCVQIFPDAILHREEADYQAKLRGQKLEESQKAYKAGHKANAHELSVEVCRPLLRAPSCFNYYCCNFLPDIAGLESLGTHHIDVFPCPVCRKSVHQFSTGVGNTPAPSVTAASVCGGLYSA